MNIPNKLKSGDQFKPSTVDTVNKIIEYLQETKLVPGNNISIDKKANGITISAKSQKFINKTSNTTEQSSSIIINGDDSTIIIKITDGSQAEGYSGTIIYPEDIEFVNGGDVLFFLDLNFNTGAIPDTICVGHAINADLIGGE